MSDWRFCSFQPFDVVAGSDTRAIDTGAGGRAGDIAPAAFAGALRTKALGNVNFPFRNPASAAGQAAEIAAAVGFETEPPQGGFQFFGPLLWEPGVGPLFPAPALHRRPRVGGDTVALAESRIDACADSGIKEARLLGPPQTHLRDDARVLTATGMINFLLARTGYEKRETHKVWLAERRYGHRRASSGATEDGALFSYVAKRFEMTVANRSGRAVADPSGYCGFVRGTAAAVLQDGRVHLGGERRLAELRVSGAADFLSPVHALKSAVVQQLESKDLVLYLATPAIFRSGWLPSATNGLRLRCAAVGRPQPVSGWKMTRAGGQPKPVRRAVPAGACYVFSMDRDEDRTLAATIVEQFHFNQSISDEQPALGFGCALFGLTERT